MDEEILKEELKKKQLLEMIRPILGKIMEKRARERLNNIRVVKPDLAMQIELYLAQLYQMKQIPKMITEEEIIKILKSLSPKKEFRIRRV